MTRSDWIALGALLISGLTFAWEVCKEYLIRRRASLKITMHIPPGRTIRTVVVTNEGPAEARNIRLKIDGVPCEQRGGFTRIGDLPTPDRLLAGASLVLQYIHVNVYHASAEWTDGSGEPGYFETMLPD